MKTEVAIQQILTEYNSAKGRFEDFNSAHEGYAIILEELDELFEAIRRGETPTRLRAEAKQIAAMAMRFMTDCT